MGKKSYYKDDNFILFYEGLFSQWAKKDIKINNIIYNCCEQYMMAEKARLFKDELALEKIMETTNPAVQKKWGRKVKNFNKNKWEEMAKKIVFKANYAKFTQNEDCKKLLLDSENRTIVEASPYDRIWGIGLSCNDPRALNPKQWRGANWLGKIIMEVRKKIKS